MAKTEDLKKGNGRGRGRPTVAAVQPPMSGEKIETGREAFNRIASYRVNAIISKLNTLAKMASGQTRYGYKEEDVEYIRRTLIASVNKTCDRLRRTPSPVGFSFDRKGEDASA